MYFSEIHHREKKKNRNENSRKDVLFSNIVINKKRIEVTCKKSSDIKKVFNLEKSNLTSILSVSQNNLKQYLCYAINQNISKLVKIERNISQNLSAIEIAIHVHFTNSIDNQHLTFLQTLETFLLHFDDKQMKIRIKKKCIQWNLDKQGKTPKQAIKETTILNDKILDIFKHLQIS